MFNYVLSTYNTRAYANMASYSFYKLIVHAEELKDRLENMDKKMPLVAISVTTKGGKK